MSEKNICPKVKVQGLSAHQSSGCLSPNLWCTLTEASPTPSVRSDGLANRPVDVDRLQSRSESGGTMVSEAARGPLSSMIVTFRSSTLLGGTLTFCFLLPIEEVALPMC